MFAALVLPSYAQAAFPGNNGKIAFVSSADGDEEIYTINPDGTGLAQLTHNAVLDFAPTWSPDGSKILFNRSGPSALSSIWVMNVDGSGQAFVTSDPNYGTDDPGWSPDATRITYVQIGTGCDSVGAGVLVANADGSNKVLLTCPTDEDGRPRWSPDGHKIAFSSTLNGPAWIYTINPDGTGLMRLTDDPSFNYDPDWSPDGSKILFSDQGWNGLATVPRNGGSKTLLTIETGDFWPSWSPDGSKIVVGRGAGSLYILNSDGTNPTFLTQGFFPDWQPIPVNAYARPQSATPLRVALAVAYQPCTSPNRTHGPPLDSGSCNPPKPASQQLTVGTPDANGEASRAVGSVRLAQVGELPIDLGNGDQSDVKIQVKITDVRNTFDLSDYAGDVGVSAARRITDKNNTPHPGGPGAATVQDDLFSFSVPCSPTSDKTVGSACELSTTADTLVPGTVVERQRAIWQLGPISIHDGGPDADPQTSPGNRLFMTQGIFVP